MKEIWKDVPEYEGLYQISSLGNIKSKKRKGTNGKIKKQISSLGYYVVDLYKNSKRKTKYLHRLICECFIENQYNKPCINHKNGIKNDNRVENLEWCSYSENNIHAYFIGLKTNCKKVKQIDENNKIINVFYSMNEASKKTKISQSQISLCCNGKIKTAGGFKWDFIL